MSRLIFLLLLSILAIGSVIAGDTDDYDDLFLSGSPYIHELNRGGLWTTSSLTFAKDYQGRLWMGGRYGISWFDGFEYHRFKSRGALVGGQAPIYEILSAGEMGMWYLNHRQSVSFYSFLEDKEYKDITMGELHVEDIASLDSGQLMLATDRGIYSLSYSNHEFQLVEIQPTIKPVRYVRIHGEELYYATEDRFYRLPQFARGATKEDLGFKGKINSMFVVDSNGAVWFSSEGDLLSINNGVVEARIPGAGATSMVLSQGGDLWIGSRGKGLWRIDTKNKRIRKVYDINSVHGLALGSDTINAVYEDESGIIWLGRFSKSAAFINPGYEAFSNIVNNPWKSNQILDNSIFYIMKHSSGDIWLGHSRKGISILDSKGQVRAYLKSFDDVSNTDAAGQHNSAEQVLPAGSVYAMVEGKQGEVYVSVGDKGVFEVSAELGSIERVSEEGVDTGRKYFNLVLDQHGSLFASGSQGVFKFDLVTKAIQHIELIGIGSYSQRTNHSFTDKDSNVWFAGRDYIGLVAAGESRITQLINPEGLAKYSDDIKVRYMYPALSHHAFVSIGDELYALNYNKQNNKILLQTISMAQSLSGRLYEDGGGNLWSSHESANPATGEYKKYGRANGVLPFVDRYFAQEKLSSTVQIHGCSEGLVVLRKDRIEPWSAEAPVVISHITFDGEHQDPNNERLIIAPQYNTVEILSAALDYSEPTSNRYAYRITGYQNEWLESDYQGRRIVINNLDPGSYELEIKGSNREGAWSGLHKVIHLTVLPAWYESYWFRFILLMLFCVSLWTLYRLRVRQLKLRQLQLEGTVADRTRDLNHSLETLQKTKDQLVESEKQASLGRLVRGVSHELNTPIGILKSSNSGLHDVALSTKASFEGGSLTESSLLSLITKSISSTGLMARNIERMVQLTSRFKQSSVDEITSDLSTFNVHQLLVAATLDFKERMASMGVKFVLDCDESLELTSTPIALRNVIAEIVENSLSHGFATSSDGLSSPIVTIRVRKPHKSGATFLIADNGRGMDEDTVRDVFEPFFSRSQHSERIGLGMHSAFNWVTQLLKGHIRVRSKPGLGTVFIVKLGCIKALEEAI